MFFFRMAYYPGGHPFFLVVVGSEFLSVSCCKHEYPESGGRTARRVAFVVLYPAAFWGRVAGVELNSVLVIGSKIK